MGALDFFGGFKLTFQHLTRPTVTTSYPKAKRPKQPRQHGRHVLNRYEDGMEKCIGCELCAGVCPVNCIYVRGLDNPPDHPVSPGERYGYVYEINYLRCIHCDLCVEACPTQAITESKMFEFSFTNRADAIYTKKELLVDDQGYPQRLVAQRRRRLRGRRPVDRRPGCRGTRRRSRTVRRARRRRDRLEATAQHLPEALRARGRATAVPRPAGQAQ
jgi:NADH-quinone oxidoreductase chain I